MDRMRMSDLGVEGRTVLLRADYNVQTFNNDVIDDHRMMDSIPTLRALRAAGSRIVIATHRANLDGRVDSDLSNAHLAPYLSRLMGCPVRSIGESVGPAAEAAVAEMSPGDILLLENLRFHSGEEANDAQFAEALARLGDVYVDDAFGTLYRSYASIVGVPRYLPSAAGTLVEREVEALEAATHPRRPSALVLGGVKFADRLPLVEHLLPELDVLCLGGLVGVLMLRALGLDIELEVSPDDAERAKRIVQSIRTRPDFRLVLPHAVIATDGARSYTLSPTQVPAGWTIVDTGLATIESFARALGGVRSVVWNGPMGVYDRPPFDLGTIELARVLADLSATTIAAGVATTAAVRRSGYTDGFALLPGGGGTALRILSGEALPGLDALPSRA